MSVDSNNPRLQHPTFSLKTLNSPVFLLKNLDVVNCNIELPSTFLESLRSIEHWYLHYMRFLSLENVQTNRDNKCPQTRGISWPPSPLLLGRHMWNTLACLLAVIHEKGTFSCLLACWGALARGRLVVRSTPSPSPRPIFYSSSPFPLQRRRLWPAEVSTTGRPVLVLVDHRCEMSFSLDFKKWIWSKNENEEVTIMQICAHQFEILLV